MAENAFTQARDWLRRAGPEDAVAEDAVVAGCTVHRAPIEAAILRGLGTSWLIALLVITFIVAPHPGFEGRGLLVLLAFLAMVAASIASQPNRRMRLSQPPGVVPGPENSTRSVLALLGVLVGAAGLALAQPNGAWIAGLYFVAIMGAILLDRRTGAVMLLLAVVPFTVGALIDGQVGTAISTSVGIVPWYLILRLMRMLGERNRELDASRATATLAAAQAERSRIAREMHDVLAHSLSALALSLESTRLLAHDHHAEPELTRAIERAHGIAATGLDDARRVLAASRGEDLPGPERLEALTGAFGEQSGLPVALEVRGAARELAPDARVAVYRTAQEALTNIRRHATPDQVRVSLDYRDDATVLVIEDHAPDGTPPPTLPGVAGSGYGLTGMRERAELLGGELVAAPTESGFRVELRLPA